MSFVDKTIVCVDCGAEFTFTANEQKQFADRGFTSDPKRCKPCRDARKATQASGNRDGGNSIGNSAGGAGGGGARRSFGGGGAGGGRSFGGGAGAGPRQMFPATCASCGQQTEVPFKPSGSRPVYCRACFQAQKATTGR